mmetsp:Transcript_18525/g.39641  ORF Transcript_18525/g.39641 Transcript_18525/m.39641 type:complete len:231 (-) Transcript_18525:982-1674(-)
MEFPLSLSLSASKTRSSNRLTPCSGVVAAFSFSVLSSLLLLPLLLLLLLPPPASFSLLLLSLLAASSSSSSSSFSSLLRAASASTFATASRKATLAAPRFPVAMRARALQYQLSTETGPRSFSSLSSSSERFVASCGRSPDWRRARSFEGLSLLGGAICWRSRSLISLKALLPSSSLCLASRAERSSNVLRRRRSMFSKASLSCLQPLSWVWSSLLSIIFTFWRPVSRSS